MSGILDGRSAGLVGISSVLVGTVLALTEIPEDPMAKGALVTSASALAAGLMIVPAGRLMARSKAMLNAENFIALGLVYWILLDEIQGAYILQGTTAEAVHDAFIAVGVFGAAMWAGTLTRPWKIPSIVLFAARMPLPEKLLERLILVCFVIGMSNFALSVDFDLVKMFSYLGSPRWAAPWGRGRLGDWTAFMDQAQYFGYIVPSLAALHLVRRGWLNVHSIIAVAWAVLVVLFLAVGGGRRIIGVTVGAALLVWLLATPKIKLSTFLGAAVGSFILLVGMQFILEIRSGGYEAFRVEGPQFSYLHIDDNFLRLSQLINLIPSKFDFVYFQQIVFTLIRPIPRVFWEGKPVDAGFDLATVLGLSDVSLSSTILGEWYLSFGWVGVAVGGWLHGRFASAVNRVLPARVKNNNPIIYSLLVMVLFAGIRSMQELVLMSYAVLAWIGATWALRSRRRQPSAV